MSVKSLGLVLTSAFLVLLMLVSCAPKAPPPTPVTPAPPLVAPPTARAITPEEAAWAKVVAAAKKEGELTFYDTVPSQAAPAFKKAFENKYGIKLEIIIGRGAEFTERLKVERRIQQQVGDVVHTTPLLIYNMKLEGLLASVADDLPALREGGVWWLEPTALDPRDKMSLIYYTAERTPYINTRLVKPEEIPSSWKDLLAPRWVGNMTFSEPSVLVAPYEYIVVFMDYKVWDEDYIRALYRQKLRFTANQPEEFRLLAAGESQLLTLGADTFGAALVREGAPIQAIGMKEGVVVSPSPAAAIAGGPHPNATRVFLNWLFSREGQAAWGEALGNKMVRKDVPDFRSKAVQVPVTKALLTNIEHVEKASELFKQKWFDKVVGR